MVWCYQVALFLWLLNVPDVFAVRNGPSSSFVDPPQDNCRRKTTKDCQELQTSTCFGVKLPYALTSNELVNENFTQHQMQNEMRRWEGLRSVPRCWAVIQPLLCSIYMPKCSDSFVDLPPQELCRIIRKPCAAIEKALKDWPSILRCEDYSKFPAHCKSTDIRELRFNTSATCMPPLKEVENPFNNYDVIEGCALNCSDPLFTPEEHESVSRFIQYLGVVTLGAQSFVLFTSIIDWKSAKQYPSATIFYANLWYAFAVLGFLVQFLPSTKEDIVCRKDLTIRRNEPQSGDKIYCPMIFFMIYFGVMSSLAWLCVFAYVSNLTCNAVGRMRERVDKKKLYFNVFAIFGPFVLTVICISMGKIDGNSATGVCFVGVNDFSARIILLIGPLSLATVIMVFYFSRGVYKLLSVTLTSSDFITERGRKEIKSYATRVAIFTFGVVVIVVTSLVTQIRLMSWKPVWEKSLQEQIYCKMNLNGNDAECELGEKADVTLVTVDVVMFFLGGLLVSSWAWTRGSLRTWSRWAKRRCGQEDKDSNHQPHMQKHRLISQAFEKRQQVQQKGRLSLSLQSAHDDPMGLNKLLDPTNLCKEDGGSEMGRETDADTDINSEWAAALPHLLVRRGALVPPHSSNSVSCVSEDNSRRPSCDSTSGSVYKKSSYRNWFSRRHSAKGKGYSWRRGAGGSTSSLESNQSQILPAITALINKNQPKGMLHGGGDFDMMLMGNGNTSPQKKAILVREVALQTSLERLPMERKVATCDVGIQSSLVSLHEIGTQTRKSATKKKREKGSKRGKEEGSRHHHEEDKQISAKEDDDEEEGEEEDPVSKLLTPV